MRKYIHIFLITLASISTVPATHAAGGFFISGQGGKIELSDTAFSDDSTDLRSLGLGYRWQAGSIVQVGVEVGGGKLGTLEESYAGNFIDGGYSERITLDTTFGFVGANARFQFGAQSRWFAIARLGYMSYEEKLRYSYEESYYWDGNYYEYSDSGSESETGGGAYFGAGIGMDITENFNLNLTHSGYAYSPYFGDEYDYDDDFYTASSTTLGIEARF